jgi:phosphatidylethanolamine/phosphatidyl-N-methylethanolamine N-methyltransferase
MSSFDPNPSPDPSEYVEKFYRSFYYKIHSQNTVSMGNNYFHRCLEKSRKKEKYSTTVELGSGNFEHFAFVKHDFDKYFATDIRTPPKELFDAKVIMNKNVEFIKLDSEKLFDKFGENSIDRILAGCLIMHLNNPYESLINWQKTLRVGGIIDIMVPCDPGLALRLVRRLLTEKSASRVGISQKQHRFINAIDHK